MLNNIIHIIVENVFFAGMNYETNKMSCKCSISIKVFDEKSTFPINIEIIKCTVESFNL